MIPWRLVFARILSHPVRSALTAASMAVAVFLICFLGTARTALVAGVESSSIDRLIVQSKVSLFVNLPEAYQAKIAAVQGVQQICKMQWFGGTYQDPSNFFAQFAIDPEQLLETYPEIVLVDENGRDAPDSAAQFYSQRSTCIIGEALAEQYDFKLGQTIPIQGAIFPRTDGAPWGFTVAGFYKSLRPNVDDKTLYFHYDYLRESLENGSAQGPPGVGVYSLKLARGAGAEQVMRDVDQLFENGPQCVQTTTEAEFQRQFVTMFGSVPTLLGAIGSGVVFAVLLAVLNTMLMAARERTREVGVLKALGFQDSALTWITLVESLALCLVGGGLGLLLALALFNQTPAALAAFLPEFALRRSTAVMAMSCALGIGLAAAIVPCWQANRLRPVQAFRGEG